MALSIDELKILIQNDEHRQLELKKTTGELKDSMHTACAFLNTEGGLPKERCRSTYMVYRWRICRGYIYATNKGRYSR